MPDDLGKLDGSARVAALINNGAKALHEALTVATQMNSMAPEVALFKELDKITSRLAQITTEVLRMRGL